MKKYIVSKAFYSVNEFLNCIYTIKIQKFTIFFFSEFVSWHQTMYAVVYINMLTAHNFAI